MIPVGFIRAKGHVGHVYPLYQFWAKNGFYLLNTPEKVERGIILWCVKTRWNLNFSVHKCSLLTSQPHSLTYLLTGVHLGEARLSSCHGDCVVAKLKMFFTVPLLKKFADPWSWWRPYCCSLFCSWNGRKAREFFKQNIKEKIGIRITRGAWWKWSISNPNSDCGTGFSGGWSWEHNVITSSPGISYKEKSENFFENPISCSELPLLFSFPSVENTSEQIWMLWVFLNLDLHCLP